MTQVLYGILVFVVLLVVYLIGFQVGVKFTRRENEEFCEKIRNTSLTSGEKVGFEKGYEAGKLEAMNELRGAFIAMLEEQLKALKTQLPGPTEEIKYV